MGPAKLQPALLGGVTIGLLTALPVVNVVNLCCCAWVIFGGALTAYLMQQNHPSPINAGDGAIGGLMAGAVGAVIGSILSVFIGLALGPYQAQLMERILQGAQDMPPEVREIFDQWRNQAMTATALGAAFVFTLLFSLCVYSVFGLLGGLLGALMFRKNVPPPPPAPPQPYGSDYSAPSSPLPPPPPPLPPTGT